MTVSILHDDYWVCRDGTKLYPNEFDNTHLVNTIRFLERNADALKKADELYYVSLPSPNGEMATLAYEDALIELISESPIEHLKSVAIYRKLVSEAKKRGLL